MERVLLVCYDRRAYDLVRQLYESLARPDSERQA